MAKQHYTFVKHFWFKALFLILAVLSVIVSCMGSKKIPGPDSAKILPPGTVKIEYNLYADVSEVTNFSYMEFMYWTGKVWGQDSLKKILPDTMVWRDLMCGRKKMLNYLRHPKWRDHPVVGVSYEQAVAFSKWRSDRVMEFLLIRNGQLKHDPAPTPQTYFSIEKYYSGKVTLKNKSQLLPYYPQYTLPTRKQWDLVRITNDSAFNAINNKINAKDKNALTKAYDTQFNCVFFNDLSPICKGDSMAKEPLRKSFHTPEKVHGLVNDIRGNVSEMSDVKGISLGGSWRHPITVVLKQDTFHYKKPDLYTGFRNVCVWKKK